MSFSSLGLSQQLLKAIEAQNYKTPTPIQKQAIPEILKGKDLLGIAKTGSGKTASYVLPILMNLDGKIVVKNRAINALILVPTRELAVQVNEVFQELSAHLSYPFRSMAVYGGVSINPQMKNLFGVNALIATPGRLLELVESKAIEFGNISTLVLDEADKMLNLGFKAEMDRIFALLPKRKQNLLFSATLSPEVQKVEQLLLQNPVVIKVEDEIAEIDLINQSGYFVSTENKGPLLRHLIESKKINQVLVFASSTHEADKVADKLYKNGISARAIHSKKTQGNRTETMNLFKSGKLKVMVATDLLSRGIDIEFLPCVINYELPRSPKDFVHRIGRTGRAENAGEAITFVTPEDTHHFKVIQKKMKKWVTMIDSENIDF